MEFVRVMEDISKLMEDIMRVSLLMAGLKDMEFMLI